VNWRQDSTEGADFRTCENKQQKPWEIESRQTKLSSPVAFKEGRIKSHLSSENLAPGEEQRTKSNQKTQHEQKNEWDSRSEKSYREQIDRNREWPLTTAR
jgi:hypothetical protein